jgi:hypothetical protein
MQVSRRFFLGVTSGATALTAFAPRGTAAQTAVDHHADPLNVRGDFPALNDYTS